VLNIPTFCVGSILAVTYADKWSEMGSSKFVGICVHINPYVNTKGHMFILRNVIMDEGVEINFPFYNPLIQKIEVLLHQRWDNEVPGVGLRFLRDYPAEYSRVEENYKQDDYPEYTAVPTRRPWTDEDRSKVVKHFEDIFHSRTTTHKKFEYLPELYEKGLKHI